MYSMFFVARLSLRVERHSTGTSQEDFEILVETTSAMNALRSSRYIATALTPRSREPASVDLLLRLIPSKDVCRNPTCRISTPILCLGTHS